MQWCFVFCLFASQFNSIWAQLNINSLDARDHNERPKEEWKKNENQMHN